MFQLFGTGMCALLEGTVVQHRQGVSLRPKTGITAVTVDEHAEILDPRAEPAYFADMALDLHDEPTAERTVGRIAEYAKAGMRCDDAGILLVFTRRRIETAAATSERSKRAHDLQSELDEGPCLDARIGEESYYLIGDTAADSRWPQWGKIVADLGIRSVISIRLETRARRYGSLNLYGAEPGMFGSDDLAVASIFARHASIALATSQEPTGCSGP